ncbi:amidohydrolase family protein [Pseudofrankia sp. DC12]|uniref:amidohydrolase family protein n=1 Tax=Pseudofrankia sp. DC12 TaxID=683315 RepID=UPI0005F8274A|nr:amidohydrolase family protein [Pseudofrankia sp. DC12]
MLIVNAEIDGVAGRAVRVENGGVVAVGAGAGDVPRPRPGEDVVDARGGMLLPGLHDHHVHLLALAALASSVPAGPPAVRTAAELATTLRAAARPGGWVRAVGYHESVAGDLDRAALDAMVGDVPVRVQHRSGAMWIVNSPALAALRAAGDRDSGGGALPADGRLFRSDERLGRLLGLVGAGGAVELAELASVGARLAGYGVTGLTDATATTGPAQVTTLRGAVEAGALPQRLLLTGPPGLDLAGAVPARLLLGPVKIVLDDGQPVDLDELAQTVRAARGHDRRVAVHCVTRLQLALALAGFDAAGGALPGDRIEHAAVLSPDLLDAVAAAGLTVVTQPHFLAERGDAYLADVDPDDVPWLYRCAGPIAAGVPLAAGTDAPFGGDDPWASMRAAVHRQAPSGRVLGPAERLTAARALDLYLGDPADPGGAPRRIVAGAPADLCLLAEPRHAVLAGLDPGPAVLTMVAGAVVHHGR